MAMSPRLGRSLGLLVLIGSVVASDAAANTLRTNLSWTIDRAGTTTTAPDYSDANIVGGKNPAWNRYGHERMGWALSVFNKAAP